MRNWIWVPFSLDGEASGSLLESWTCPAKCKFQRISSIEGLSVSFSWRHLTHISIIVFSESSEHPLCIAGSTMLFRAISSVFRLTCKRSLETWTSFWDVICPVYWRKWFPLIAIDSTPISRSLPPVASRQLAIRLAISSPNGIQWNGLGSLIILKQSNLSARTFGLNSSKSR